ncbi:MAG: hypothetical protein K0S53_276 [Bacteroidetes bacterium]|jgi:hypothetical protein|nr:hypothetical protein [Bacteroidota bacterium]MDF2452798.1 hypothetical protein [Bacteroidota bacterium]
MKYSFFILVFFILGCKEKSRIKSLDLVEMYVGSYNGMEIHTDFADSISVKDTLQIEATLSKTSMENVVNFSYNQKDFLFRFKNGIFSSLESFYSYPRTTLRKSRDSLYFQTVFSKWGTEWTDCIVKKQN